MVQDLILQITYTLPTSSLTDLTSYDHSALPTNTEPLWTPNFRVLNTFPFQRNLVPLLKMLYLGFHAIHLWLYFILDFFSNVYLRVLRIQQHSKTNHNIRTVLYLVYNSFETWHFILYLVVCFIIFYLLTGTLFPLRIVFSALLSVPSKIPNDLLWFCSVFV